MDYRRTVRSQINLVKKEEEHQTSERSEIARLATGFVRGLIRISSMSNDEPITAGQDTRRDRK